MDLTVVKIPSGGSSTQAVATTSRLTPRSSPSSPLTPADSGNKDERQSATSGKGPPAPTPVTPQISPPAGMAQSSSRETKPSAAAEAREASRPKQSAELHGVVPAHPKEPPAPIVLPKGDSLPGSQDASPATTPAAGSGAT